MIKLAVTGNIASGKTLVETFLKEQGIVTIDADEIVHNLLENNIEIKNQVFNLFKDNDIKDENGEISRLKIGSIVFKDREKLRKLENLIHPAVKVKIEQFFIENKEKDIAVAVIPLLFESGMENQFDYIILIVADIDSRIKRLIKRSNLTYEEAMDRINSQMSQEEKIKKADFVVDNNSTPKETKSQILDILSKLKSLI
ncbi:MAG: dephospho-CoA kinase [Candidatus Gastranaerophilales bacterium]|nr:dephospho-CoA kinase [Candidatus Gastranaerophilales bacterium]